MSPGSGCSCEVHAMKRAVPDLESELILLVQKLVRVFEWYESHSDACNMSLFIDPIFTDLE